MTALLLALLIALCAARLLGLLSLWRLDSVSSMGPLILIASLLLLYRKRNRFSSCCVESHWLGPALLLALVVLNPWAPLTPFIVILGISGIVLTVWGKAVLKEMAFPLGFLIFMVPIPPAMVAALDYPLQLFCARVTEFLAKLAGFQVSRQGAAILLSNFHMFIAPECNGLRSATALLALAVFWTHVVNGRPALKGLLIASAIPIAYACNFCRLFADVWVTNALGQSRFIRYEHMYDLACGFLIFLASAWALIQVGEILKCRGIKAIS